MNEAIFFSMLVFILLKTDFSGSSLVLKDAADVVFLFGTFLVRKLPRIFLRSKDVHRCGLDIGRFSFSSLRQGLG